MAMNSELALTKAKPLTYQISSLKYEIKLLKNQQALLESSRDKEIRKLEQKCLASTQKCNEAVSLQSFLNEENKKIQSKLDDSNSKVQKLTSKLKKVEEKYHDVKNKFQEVEYELQNEREQREKVEFNHNNLELDHMRMKQSSKHQISSLESRLSSLIVRINELEKENIELQKKIIQQDSQENSDNSSSASHTFELLKELDEIRSQNTQLESKLLTNELELENVKTDSSLIEILHGRVLLQNKRIESYQETLANQTSQMESIIDENMTLKHQKEQLYVIFKVDKMTNDLSEYANRIIDRETENKSLVNEIDLLKDELNHYKDVVKAHYKAIHETNLRIEDVTKRNDQLVKKNWGLNNQLLSTSQELNFLQSKFDRLQDYSAKSKYAAEAEAVAKTIVTGDSKSEDQTTASEDKKTIIDSQQKYIEALKASIKKYLDNQNEIEPSRKRQKLEDGTIPSANQESLVGKYFSQIVKYKEEISKLTLEIKKLEKKNSTLYSSNDTLTTQLQKCACFINEKQEHKAKVLSLYNELNPMYKYQKIKKETMEALKKENTDLLNKLKDEKVESIPLSVLERYLVDYKNNEDEKESLNKKLDRLKKVYQNKSKELLSTISILFGYTIEIMPNGGKIKMIPVEQSENNYFNIDPSTKSMQLSRNASEEFAEKCDRLVKYWVEDRGKLSGFLAELSLAILQT